MMKGSGAAAMRIMVIADIPSKALWDHFEQSRLEGIDLILSCGDLPAEYLSFLVTFAHCPLLYVHGNHDTRYDRKPPEGCVCIDDQIYHHEGIRILGLGGSMRYKEGTCQYTEKEMEKRIRKLRFSLWKNRGFDILVTHAPARGHNDQKDLAHQGFEAFGDLMSRYQPRYMVHGHVHMNYGRAIPRESTFMNTKVINAYERYTFVF